MAYKIYIREAESDIDVMWHDVTDRILVGNLKLRQGFSSLGSGADLGKITLTYKAYRCALLDIDQVHQDHRRRLYPF